MYDRGKSSLSCEERPFVQGWSKNNPESAAAWFDLDVAEGYSVHEHSIQTGYGDVLSWLWWKDERTLIGEQRRGVTSAGHTHRLTRVPHRLPPRPPLCNRTAADLLSQAGYFVPRRSFGAAPHPYQLSPRSAAPLEFVPN